MTRTPCRRGVSPDRPLAIRDGSLFASALSGLTPLLQGALR